MARRRSSRTSAITERLSLKMADRISFNWWRALGGLQNPRLARVTRGKSWAYFHLH